MNKVLYLYDINEGQYDEIKYFIESKKVKYEGGFLVDPITIKTNDDWILDITLNHDSTFDRIVNSNLIGNICILDNLMYVAIENINQNVKYGSMSCLHTLHGKSQIIRKGGSYATCVICKQKFKVFTSYEDILKDDEIIKLYNIKENG